MYQPCCQGGQNAAAGGQFLMSLRHKHNADRRHHILKMAFKVQNRPEYEKRLRRRGSLTLWIEDKALQCGQTCGSGGQARYSDTAIRTSLMVRSVFKLPLGLG
jgi:hypothetical protein